MRIISSILPRRASIVVFCHVEVKYQVYYQVCTYIFIQVLSLIMPKKMQGKLTSCDIVVAFHQVFIAQQTPSFQF